jgi:DNA-binding CsgD family transcriptional regulator
LIVNAGGQAVAEKDAKDLALALRDALDADGERGCVVLTLDRHVLYANPTARIHLRDGTARGTDPLLPENLDRWIASFAADVNSDADISSAQWHYPSDGERRLRVSVEAVRHDGSEPVLVVRTAAATAWPEPTVRRLQARFRLTLREAQVAAGVSKGLSNAEVASRLGIVEKTVKNVLMGVFAKCGVRNRVELALRIYDAPIPPPD